MSSPKENSLPASFDSRERVALDLMKAIDQADSKSLSVKMKNPKTYLMDLYLECLEVVSGKRPESLGVKVVTHQP